jgi:hypothetical protein
MASSMDSVCESVRVTLERLAAEDQRLFLEEKERCVEERLPDSPLLDQLCCLRLVMTRLSEGYARALAAFEDNLERRSKMGEGWRRSTARKVAGEYESPMPWVHPFRLAREELEPLEEELQAAVATGETEQRDPGRLLEVLEKHELGLPLPSPHVQPRFRPGVKPEI